ncbi:hypothetical protein HPB48_018095 [Haemaphysalis longicornis]|uniref:TGF-beta family profile domain-containing protein n=1 Tax=Haemaphysalis longicornis TaxID=44386 RepID=A0A9J6FS48_HAELO|nr:hypothetical protein HPB48_018095 [Haemaphysalis longicornis]
MANLVNSHECTSRGPHPGSCFVFHLNNELSSRSVGQAELWVFKDLDPSAASSGANHTFAVSELSVDSHRSNRHRHKRVVAFESSSPRPGWFRFDLTQLVSQWAGRRNRPRGLEISCKTCRASSASAAPIGSSGDKQPFLVVRTDPNAPAPSSRSRRSVDCNGSISRCCRESFYVSFKEIGWDSWIIQPTGYSANFCRGTCIHDISVNKYHHTTVLQRFLQSAAGNGANDTLKLSLCCTPSRLSSISLIFIDGDQVLKQKSLPNMVVEACECASTHPEDTKSSADGPSPEILRPLFAAGRARPANLNEAYNGHGSHAEANALFWHALARAVTRALACSGALACTLDAGWHEPPGTFPARSAVSAPA